MAEIRLLLDLSENWTMLDPRDLRLQVDLAVEAERIGFNGIMFSEHIVMGRGADANGEPLNLREFVEPGNQHPSTPWPNSIVMMSAVAAATSRIRVVGAAVIAPLRHPLLLAKELATLDLLTEGRLVVLPTVSWHEAEYDALGIPFHRRGEILDEQLEILRTLWTESPVSHRGKHFQFDDVWLEPKPFRPTGPRLWFGGASLHDRLLRRLVRYGSGYMAMGPYSREDRDRIAAAFSEAGRDFSALEFMGGIAGRFQDSVSCANLDDALGTLTPQLRLGARTFVVKPNQFIDDASQFPEFGREVLEKANAIAAEVI